MEIKLYTCIGGAELFEEREWFYAWNDEYEGFEESNIAIFVSIEDAISVFEDGLFYIQNLNSVRFVD